MALAQAISAGDTARAAGLLDDAPDLATAGLTADATFEWPKASYIGDTALHIAAAVYAAEIAERLIGLGADVHARNRRGAQPLHYAAVGLPDSAIWNPQQQAATIALLIRAGADPNAADKSGVMPLHRAVRTRSAVAVRALLDGGANVHAINKNGSTPMHLATLNSGRGGAGSAAAKAEQAEILLMLARHIARSAD
jgi:ankyrin repeat protein